MTLLKDRISDIVRNGEEFHVPWEFNEDHPLAGKTSIETIPGQIVCCIEQFIDDEGSANRIIGLLTAYAARRCLVAWFLYCDNGNHLKWLTMLSPIGFTTPR